MSFLIKYRSKTKCLFHEGRFFHFGRVFDQNAVDSWISSRPQPTFKSAAPHLHGSGEDKDVFFWEAEENVLGKQLPPWDQGQLGSCVSHGSGRAAQDLLLIQIALGNIGTEQWEGDEVAREPIYGGSRVQVGGEGGYSDGSTGSWAAEWLEKWGIVWYGSNGLSGTYDTNRCREWGNSGVPSEYQTKAKDHPIKTMTQVKTANDARDALANGYPISICGDVSRSMSRQKNGFCPQTGNDWPHCFPAGTVISGPEYKFIENIKVGDIVYGHDGKPHHVLKLFKHEHSGEFITINIVGSPSIKVTSEHPFLVCRETEIKGITKNEWVEARNLHADDILFSPRCSTELLNNTPTWEPAGKTARNIPKSIVEPDRELAWLFGLYIADGDASPNHRIRITLGINELTTVNKAVDIIKRRLGLSAVVHYKATYCRIVVYSASLANSFRKWFGAKAPEKQIPEFLFYGWDLYEIIDGIFHGDGNYTNSRSKVITTTSKILAYQIKQCLISSNQYVNINKIVKKGRGVYANAKVQYFVTYNVLGKNKQNYFTNEGLTGKISEVFSTNENMTVYNFEVDEVNSYIADGIAVHNCQQLCGVCMVKGGTPAFVYRNSWGDYLGSSNNQVELESGRTITLPGGVYLSDFGSVESDLKQGDSYAYSQAVGWPAQNISWYV